MFYEMNINKIMINVRRKASAIRRYNKENYYWCGNIAHIFVIENSTSILVAIEITDTQLIA